MAVDAGWQTPIRWRAYTNNRWNHAPAWLRDTIIVSSDFQFDATDNTSRWVVAHEVCHLMQSRRHKWWWLEYTLDSRRYEDEANEFADLHMEKRK